MKKLLLIPMLSLFFLAANAQVYNAGTTYAGYTDIAPDSLMHYVYFPFTNQTVNLNVFGGPPDIEFVARGAAASGGSIAYISVRSLGPTVYLAMSRLDSVFDSTSTSWLVTKVAKPLSLGEQINAPGTVWDNSLMYISDQSASFGWTKNVDDWIGGDKYLGFKYEDGTYQAYGWIRLECISEDSCFVKDYSTTELLAGIRESAVPDVVVYPNPGSGKYTVTFDPLSAPQQIALYDLAGKLQFKRRVQNSQEELDLTGQEAGIYFLQATTEAGSWNAKIVKR